jgi:diadenosine tetraphosphate (Ap4A) HIT family hydrolase
MKQGQACTICRRVSLWRGGRNPYFIHEFKHSIFVVGDHQFHRGYSLLLLKEHVRELHELEEAVFMALSQELLQAGRAIVETFNPWKMNYSCYGNVDPHTHRHLFPRYESEPDHLNHPWLHASELKGHLIDTVTAQDLGKRIKEHLVLPCGNA